jgi:hypothetical protein
LPQLAAGSIFSLRNRLDRAFSLDDGRGPINVNVGDALHETSLFVVQAGALNVTYRNCDAARHGYVSAPRWQRGELRRNAVPAAHSTPVDDVLVESRLSHRFQVV